MSGFLPSLIRLGPQLTTPTSHPAHRHGEPRPTPVDYSFQKTYGGINVHVKDPKTGVSFKQLEREHNPTYKEIKKGIFPGYVNNGKALDYARQKQRKP